MRLNNVEELFNYLSSLEGIKIHTLKNNSTIWLPKGVVLNGIIVDKIDYSSMELVDCENSFV
jgi:hypothetical protein